MSTINTFVIHKDELVISDVDTSSQGTRNVRYMLPLRSVLNLFERARSNFLGGPHVLRQMQIENNLLWVVTSIDDLMLHYPGTEKLVDTIVLFPGQTVVVKTDALTKRKGMIVEFHQTVEIIEQDHQSQGDTTTTTTRIATGFVSICAMDTVTGKPTSNIPPHIKALFVEGS